MKKTIRKLALKTETIKPIAVDELVNARGGITGLGCSNACPSQPTQCICTQTCWTC